MQKKDPTIGNRGGAELSSRVTELETAFAKLKQASPSSWQRWLEVSSKLLLPLLLFLLVLIFKDSVQQALESRRLEVSSAQAIEHLLQTLHAAKTELGRAHAAALTLSAYGEAAIMPLVGALEHSSPNTETAVKQGLFVIGLSYPDAVTQSLGTVLSKREGQFRWQTHQAAIEILGNIQRKKGQTELLNYRPLLENGLAAWKRVVRGADNEKYGKTQETLKKALAKFGIDWKPPVTGGEQ